MAMNCQRMIDDELVEKYLNGRLEAAVQDDFEVHLLECPSCQERTEVLLALREGLQLRQQEIRALPTRPARRLSFSLAWAVAAALLVAAGVFGFYQFRQRSHGRDEAVHQPAQAPQPDAPVSPTQSHNGGHPPKTTPAPETPRQKEQIAEAPLKRPAVAVPTPTPQISIVETHPKEDLHPENKEKPALAVRKKPAPQLSEEAALELYRLGVAEAPPFTFGGIAIPDSASGTNQNGKSTGLSQGAYPAASDRAGFRKAMLAYLDKRYAEAGDLLESVVRAEPAAADANFYLGVCRLQQGHPADAIAPFKVIVAARPSVLTQPAHFYLAKAYLQLGKLAEGESEMQAAAGMPGRLTEEARSLAGRIAALRRSIPE